jgi:hypothetical protein
VTLKNVFVGEPVNMTLFAPSDMIFSNPPAMYLYLLEMKNLNQYLCIL